MAEINKQSLAHLAKLARLELTAAETEKFVADLGNILGHFKELESLNTEHVMPMTGGTILQNVLREDKVDDSNNAERKRIIDAFPEKEKGYLKTPAVFGSHEN